MSDRTGTRILDKAISRLGDEKQQDLSDDERRFSEIIDLIKNVLADIISKSSPPILIAQKQTTLHMMDLCRLLRLIAKRCQERSLKDSGSRLCVKFVSSPVGSPLAPYGERSGHLIVFHSAISVLELLCRHSTEAKDWFRLRLPENLSDALLPSFYAQFINELLAPQAFGHWKRFHDECETSRVKRLIPEKGAKAVNGSISGEFADIFINSEDCRPLFTADGLKEAFDEINRLPWFSFDNRQPKIPSAGGGILQDPPDDGSKPTAEKLKACVQALICHKWACDELGLDPQDTDDEVSWKYLDDEGLPDLEDGFPQVTQKDVWTLGTFKQHCSRARTELGENKHESRSGGFETPSVKRPEPSATRHRID